MIYKPLVPFLDSDTAFALARLMLPHRKYRLDSLLELNQVAGKGPAEIKVALERFADMATSEVQSHDDDSSDQTGGYIDL